jgi:3-methyladenine DNA glycosylase/8-oxoguanine DNA glycosylase
MAQKVVLNPVDFEKVVSFVTDQKVSINHLKRATEVVNILGGAQLMDITPVEPTPTKEEEVKA